MFWTKNMFLAYFEALHIFLFRITMIITFLLRILVIQLHTYCDFVQGYFKSKNVNFSIFGKNAHFSHYVRYVFDFDFFLVASRFIISIFLDSNAHLLTIVYFRSKKLYFCDFLTTILFLLAVFFYLCLNLMS